MQLRNGEHGYGAVTKALHWLTFLVVVAQFVVGYTMEVDDAQLDRRHEACEATVDSDAADAEEERCEEAAERDEEAAEHRPSDLHLALGVAILVLAGIRVLWRLTTHLPPWSAAYGQFGRTLQRWLEKAMLALLFLVPISGFMLAYGDAALVVHVTAHLAFYVAVGMHIALQLFHTVIRPDRHLARML